MIFWSGLTTRVKVMSIFVTFVVGITGMIVGVSQAWSVLGWHHLATREWVHAEYGTQMRLQSQTVYDIRRGQLDREIFALEQIPKRTTAEEFRLRQLRDEMKKLDHREGK